MTTEAPTDEMKAPAIEHVVLDIRIGADKHIKYSSEDDQVDLSQDGHRLDPKHWDMVNKLVAVVRESGWPLAGHLDMDGR